MSVKKIITSLAIALSAFCFTSGAVAADTPVNPSVLNAPVLLSTNPHIVLNKNHGTFTLQFVRKDTDNYVWKITSMPDWLLFVSHQTTYIPYAGYDALEEFTFQINNAMIGGSTLYGSLDFSLKHANDGLVNWENKHFSVTYYPEF